MRDRLIELLNIHQDYGTKHFHAEGTEEISSMSNELIADYLLENGVIVPPCNVGTTIYMIVEKRARVTREYFRFIKKTKLTYLNLERVIQGIGKTVFLTKEKAEQKLGKLQASYEQVKGGAE